MSDEKSGIDIVTVKALVTAIKMLITDKIPPNNYLAALAFCLGETAAHTTTSKERFHDHILKACEDAFDLERERLLAMPKVREQLEAWESGKDRDSVH